MTPITVEFIPEGIICASRVIEDAVKIKTEVDDYVTLDNAEISFD